MRTILDAHSAVRCGVETRRLRRAAATADPVGDREARVAAAEGGRHFGAPPLEAATAAFIMADSHAQWAAVTPPLRQGPLHHGPLAPCSAGCFPALSSSSCCGMDAPSFTRLSAGRSASPGLISTGPWTAWPGVGDVPAVSGAGVPLSGVRYEDLVLDPPLWSAACPNSSRLPSEPAMLSPWLEVGRHSDQVRQPLYLASLAAWAPRGMSPEFALAAPRLAPMLEGLATTRSGCRPATAGPNPAYWRNASYY
uniref:PPE family protein n=1 Tax=Macrostomum lignano TaxID=282301 RepID=A0A1I8F7V6_9PLAT